VGRVAFAVVVGNADVVVDFPWCRFGSADVGRTVVAALFVAVLASCSGGSNTDPAIWSVEPDAIDATTTGFTALVTRAGCNGGDTGEVREPSISLGKSEIEVTFEVEPAPDGYQLCPGNDAVAVVVDLGEPIGDRALIDGLCVEGRAAATTGVCSGGPVRWEPPPQPPVCDLPTAPAAQFDLSLVPIAPPERPSSERDAFGQAVVDALTPMVVGADASPTVAQLRADGWTVTIVESSAATTTVTPDLLWSRLVVTLCGDRIEAVSFD